MPRVRVVQFTAVRVDHQQHRGGVQLVLRQQPVEVAVQPQQDPGGALVGILVAQALDLAVDARHAHGARQPVARHIDQRQMEALAIVRPHVDEVSADVGSGAVAEVEAHPARVERLGEERLVHRARLQELAPHLHEPPPHEARLEAVAVPAQPHVAEDERGHEEERGEEHRQHELQPLAALRREPSAQQHPAEEDGEDRLERLAPTPREEQRCRHVPHEDREERHRRRVRAREQHARLESEGEEAERDDHARRGIHQFGAGEEARSHVQPEPGDHHEAGDVECEPDEPGDAQIGRDLGLGPRPRGGVDGDSRVDGGRSRFRLRHAVRLAPAGGAGTAIPHRDRRDRVLPPSVDHASDGLTRRRGGAGVLAADLPRDVARDLPHCVEWRLRACVG